ncbi:hypothetical protein GCM10010842_30700 [Deinococcus daejeonensis]|uniref:Uncharacterized protein n=1 Tax=Deinococcus daejeonensis TaxID=1007098 RepID=A0ABQ2JD15_9DEIO|nr:hypothetical protein GCM10010842_30700 [Deinococcus daejeonensis]
MKASVDVRDLMTLRAAALQVQAKRGASFAPPRPSLTVSAPPRDPGGRAVEATDAASPVPASPVPASPVPAPQDLPTDAGPWLDAELPDDLIDQLAGADAWPDAPEPEPQVTSPRRTDPTPPPAVPPVLGRAAHSRAGTGRGLLAAGLHAARTAGRHGRSATGDVAAAPGSTPGGRGAGPGTGDAGHQHD